MALSVLYKHGSVFQLTFSVYDITYQADGEVHVHWKGASEIVLASCRSYIDEDGNVAPMTEDKVCEKKSNLLTS